MKSEENLGAVHLGVGAGSVAALFLTSLILAFSVKGGSPGASSSENEIKVLNSGTSADEREVKRASGVRSLLCSRDSLSVGVETQPHEWTCFSQH